MNILAGETKHFASHRSRNVLHKAHEFGLKTIALCVIYSAQRNFPPDLGAHIALRTTRRFLEQYKSETVVLCLESHDRGIYEVLAPLYFPRNDVEESSALWKLPRDIGGILGEPQYPDRQIRIIHNPQHAVMIGGEEAFWWPKQRVFIRSIRHLEGALSGDLWLFISLGKSLIGQNRVHNLSGPGELCFACPDHIFPRGDTLFLLD